MTKSKKQLLLGATAGITAIVTPLATAVSCGKKEQEPALSVNDSSNGMGITWNAINSSTSKFNAVQEELKIADELAKKHNWDQLYSFKIEAEEFEDLDEKDKLNYAKKINKEINDVISKLDVLHQRTLVIAAKDIPNELGKLEPFNYFEIKVYDTLPKNSKDISPEFAHYIDTFLKRSNVKGKTHMSGADLDILNLKGTSLEKYTTRRYMSSPRSFRKFDYNNDKTLGFGDSFYDNGIFNDGHQTVALRKELNIMDNKDEKGIDVVTSPVFDLEKGLFKENLTFYEGVEFPNTGGGDTATIPEFAGGIVGDTPTFNEYSTVFSANPVVQHLDDEALYSSINELSYEKTKEYFGMIHFILLKLSKTFPGGIPVGMKLLKNVMPNLSPFVNLGQTWIDSIQEIYVENGEDVDKAVEYINKLIDSKKEQIWGPNGVIRKSNRTSLKRLAYSYDRDLNPKMINAITLSPPDLRENLFKVTNFNGDFKKAQKAFGDLIEEKGAKLITGANPIGLSWLFDYLNTLSIIGGTLFDAYQNDAGYSSPISSIYK